MGKEWVNDGNRKQPGEESTSTVLFWCRLNGLFGAVPPVTVSASFVEAVNKIGALGVRGRFPPTFILPAVP